MPRVMRVQRQVEVVPTAGIRVPNGAPQGAFGVDTAQATDILLRVQEREKQKASQVAVLEADNGLSSVGIKLQTAALAKKGKDALGAFSETRDAWDKAVSEIEGSLSSDDVKQAFRQRAMQRWQSLHATVERHTAVESERHDEATTKAAVTLRQNDALTNYADSGKVAFAIAETRAIIGDYASRNGWSSKQKQAFVATTVSATHTSVIDRMLTAGDDRTATAYYAANKKDIIGTDAEKIDKGLEVGSTEGEAMRAAGTVWSSLGPQSPNAPVKIAEMEDAIRAKYEGQPKVIKAALADLRTRASAFNAQQSELTASNKAAVLGAFNTGASLSVLTRMPEYRALAGDAQEAIKSHVVGSQYTATERAYAANQRAESEQAKRGLAAYWTLSNPTTLDGMSEAQIIAQQPALGRSLVTSLLTAKRSLVKNEGEVRIANIDDDLFKTLAHGAGLKPYDTKADEDDKATLGRLKTTVEAEIDQLQQKLGRRATVDEKRGVMSTVIDRKVMVDSWGTDEEVSAVSVRPDDRGQVYVPIADVPKDFVTQALSFLRSSGLPGSNTTDQALLTLHKKRVQRAYGARMVGATRDEITKILTGKE